MNRRILGLLAASTLIAGGSIIPAHAEAAAVCQLAGTVRLDSSTALTNAEFGSGSFSSGGLLVCSGSVQGQANVAGDFKFCAHNRASIQDVSPEDGWDDRSARAACHDASQNGPREELDAAYDEVIAQSGQGLIAHFLGGRIRNTGAPISASGFAIGGDCAFSFAGHATAAQAEITITSFTCSGLPGVVMKGNATATAGFAVQPCSEGLCFQDVVFLGTITLTDVV
ncbi:MAG TPA: hypothetical protein VGB83_12180 [Actinomycetota bacterium]